MVHKLKVKIVGQSDKRIHFQIFENDILMFDDPDFSKHEILELITEGNHDIDEAEEERRRKMREERTGK